AVNIQADRQAALLSLRHTELHFDGARDPQRLGDLLPMVPIDDDPGLVHDDRDLNAVVADGLLKVRVLLRRERRHRLEQHSGAHAASPPKETPADAAWGDAESTGVV